MKAVGATEAQRAHMISAIRAGKSLEEATRPWRDLIEDEWFTRNADHLVEVARSREQVTTGFIAHMPRELLESPLPPALEKLEAKAVALKDSAKMPVRKGKE